ncbi:phage terminase large subunit [Tundrisphaera sp. TA3]|uniref:phage terminase large subunit n=1 Tax=Tundrisphaera sp. TA3 TaxID=3435775 RepID=UPI003EBDCF7C
MACMTRPTKTEAFDALLRTRLAAFTRKAFSTVDPSTPYSHNWHIDLIAEYLEACTRREIKRLIINIPPRNMKSISVTVAWPAWLLGLNPAERIIAASFAYKLSLKLSVDTRLIMGSEWYRRIFPGTQISGDTDTKEKFITTRRGMRLTSSVDGSPIGEGGDFLIVDDPLSATAAISDTQREAANVWFDQGFSTRLNDKKNGVIVLVMQRLHTNDLTGHLLEKGGWEHLCLPAIAEKNETITFGRVSVTRKEGEALHPGREDLEVLARQKIALGSYGFAGQYQQRPAPAEGGIFKSAWLRRFREPQEKYLRIVQSWDTAYKPGQLNDPSCCTTWGEKPDGFDLLHVMVKRLEYPELKNKLILHAAEWQADAVLIEDKASGQSLIQDLRRDTQLPVIAILPRGDKETRASAVSALVEAGKVFVPEQAAWLTDFEMELMTFPNSVHDDQVDSLSQFLEWSKGKPAEFRIRSL